MAPLQSVLTPAACGGLPTVEREEITQQRLALRLGNRSSAPGRPRQEREGRGGPGRAWLIQPTARSRG